ncbi:MAG: M81 family metallopeptidase [Anaerolineae bacterium]
MKLFTASLGTETNTFSPMPTGYTNFAETCLVRNGDHGDQPSGFAGPLLVFREKAKQRGWSIVESLCTFAQPAGVTVRSVYELFRDEILDDLRAAMPVDMVLLSPHGAMIANGYDDCEGDLLSQIRDIVGSDVPIGAELDLHCHLTQKMVDNATALVIFKEYPHIDIADRAAELFDIIADTAQGRIKPTSSVFDCRMIGIYYTTTEPMQSYIAQLKRLEGQDGVLSISVVHGFPWADVPEMGTKILVITDDRREHGDALVAELGRQLFDQRQALRPNYLSIDEGLQRALEIDRSPVVLADVSDNAGGGAPGDSTFILRTMLERGIQNAALACIWDPIAVSVAMDAGVGAKLDLRIGGKMGPMSGDPLDLHVTVTGVKRNATQTFGPEDSKATVQMGDTVAVHAEGIDIVLNSIRTQTFSPECFSTVGIDPQKKHILVVKSTQHFYAAFAPIASEVLYITAPGAMVFDFSKLPYKRIDPNKWPLAEDPFSQV